jgi:hypothetical protein
MKMDGGGHMRQGQQNRRNRGRGRSRAGNPLTKTYESNGPDVKIKGTAADIAQKYMALARDQLASGNNVMAENYLQHAEHYNRIIMAAQAKQEELSQQQGRPHNGMARFEADDFGDDDEDDVEDEAAPAVAIPGYGEQPVVNIEITTPAVPIDESAAAAEKPRRRMARQRRPQHGESRGAEPAEASDAVKVEARSDDAAQAASAEEKTLI